jgi:flagellum-specific ATP synthase
VTSALLDRITAAARPEITGRVAGVVGLHVDVCGVDAAIGDAVTVESAAGPVHCEVVALDEGRLVCMPYGDLSGVRVGAPVRSSGAPATIGVGPGLLGRVLDGLGRPIDGRPLPTGLDVVTPSAAPRRTRCAASLSTSPSPSACGHSTRSCRPVGASASASSPARASASRRSSP